MITQRTRGLQSLLILSQTWLFLLLYWLWFLGMSHVNPPAGSSPLRAYSVYCFWLLAGLFLETISRKKWDAAIYEFSLLKHAPVASRQTAFAFAVLFIYLALSRDAIISRLFLFTILPLEYFLLLWTNHALPEILVRLLFRGEHEVRTLLVGPRKSAGKLGHWLQRKTRFGFHTVGILDDGPEDEDTTDYPVLGGISDIEEVIAAENVKQVILLNYLTMPDYCRGVIERVQAMGVRTLIMSNIEELLQHKVAMIEDDGLRFMALHEEPLENPLHRGLKRLVDLSIAVPVVTIILPPLCAIVWLLQRLQSPGPLFHRQTRAGIQNREFTIIKFRSMHEGHDTIEKQATENDERIFPAGRWLRKLGLDEFPQFLNVLRGEMSVVGPRPHLVQHNREFARLMAGYNLRTFVKPGITGLAQVRGFRGEAHTMEDIQARLQSDMNYLENWSAPLDVAIILRTIWQIAVPAKREAHDLPCENTAEIHLSKIKCDSAPVASLPILGPMGK